MIDAIFRVVTDLAILVIVGMNVYGWFLLRRRGEVTLTHVRALEKIAGIVDDHEQLLGSLSLHAIDGHGAETIAREMVFQGPGGDQPAEGGT